MVLRTHSPHGEQVTQPLRVAIARVNELMEMPQFLADYAFLLRGPPRNPPDTLPYDEIAERMRAMDPKLPATAKEVEAVRALLHDDIEVIVMSLEDYNAGLLVDSRADVEDYKLFQEGEEYLLGWYARESAIWKRKIFINEEASAPNYRLEQVTGAEHYANSIVKISVLHEMCHLITDTLKTESPLDPWFAEDVQNVDREAGEVYELHIFGGMRIKSFHYQGSFQLSRLCARVYPNPANMNQLPNDVIERIIRGPYPWREAFEALTSTIVSQNPTLGNETVTRRWCGVCDKRRNPASRIIGRKPVLTDSIADVRDHHPQPRDPRLIEAHKLMRREKLAARAVIPKSTNPSRIRSNFQDFELSPEDMKTLDSIKKHHRTCDPKEFWGIDLFKDGEKGNL
ncbi:hypothetical protein HK104_009767 [Borealophlyctis nickersoniae]|nr:hypothetical protein HK104_009767 [Borealophlyctis nickersoniae]